MGGFSWVTLATNDSYSLGALVLAHSLQRVGTVHQLVVMVTPGVTQSMREKLRSVFDLVYEVNILDSKDERNLLLLQRPELGITFTKLHCWRLIQYDKCVFLDADTLVLQNCDELFEREEFSAAPDVGWPDCFNSGVFVYKPSEETFNSLLAFALEKGSFDGGDQGLLNLYFSDWAHKDISKHLPFIYNMCSTACYSYLPAFKQFGENVKIVHFIGNSKPWLQYFNSETLHVSCTSGFEHLQLVFEHWWNLFCSHVHSGLAPTMAWTNAPIASSCTSSSHTFTSNVNESKCEDSLYTEQFCGTDLDNVPIWDPWENYQPVDNTFENKTTDETALNNLVVIEPSSYHLEKVEDTVENSCLETFSHSAQINDIPINSNLENVECKYDVNIIISHSSQPVEHVKIINNPSSNSCTNNQCFDLNPPSAYESVTSTVVCDTKSTSTVTITTEQPVTQLNNVEAGTDPNSGLAGAFAQMTLREPRSANQGALEEQLRRQGWEAGRIDYLGQDSFDNVWKKICQTMSTPLKKESTPPKEKPTIPVSTPKSTVDTKAPVPTPASVPETAIVPSVEPPVVEAVSTQVTAPQPAPIKVAEAFVPVVGAALPSPVAEAIVPASVVEAVVPSPVVPAPVIEAIVPTPVVEAVIPSPVDAVPVSTPVVEAVAKAVATTSPIVEAVAPVPVVEAVAPVPVVEAVAPVPVVEAVAPVPVVEAVAPVPVVEATAPAPVVEAAPAVVIPTPITETVTAPIPIAEAIAPTSVTEPIAPTSIVEAVKSTTVAEVAPAAITPPQSAEVKAAPESEPVPTPIVETAPKAVADAPSTLPSVPVAVLPTTDASTPTSAIESSPSTPAVVATSTPIASEAKVESIVDTAAPKKSKGSAKQEQKAQAAESPKTETKAAEEQTSAKDAPATKTEETKPVEKPKSEGKKQGAKSEQKPKTESTEGQSSEATPVPPPRKTGKNGGAPAKKSPKKK